MELGIMDPAAYTSGFNDNDLFFNMCNRSFSSMNFDNDVDNDNRSTVDYQLGSLIGEKDLDPQWNEKAPNSWTDSANNPKQPSKSLFDDDADSDLDLDRWMYKPKTEWKKTDSINWLLWAGMELGHSYGKMSPQLAITGKDLLYLSKEDFRNYDPHFGEQLHDLLHGKRVFSSRSKEFANGKRPRLLKFIIHLLLSPEYCPGWIRWVDHKKKTFRFEENEKVANLWGQLNNKSNMTYKKFSRAIRHYYNKPDKETAIFVPVDERLVYQFGKTVKGLETDNPNFDPEYWSSTNMKNLSIED